MRLGSLAICAFALLGCWDSAERAAEDRKGEPSPLVSRSPLDDVSSPCAEGTEREVGFDEVGPAGFSAEDLLANIEGTHEEVIRWTTPIGLTVGPETDERSLSVTIERSGEGAREFDPTTDVIGHGAHCQPWLIVEVTVTIQSEDHALNERFVGEVYAMDPRVAHLRAESTELALGGELSVMRDDPQEHLVSETFELTMTLSEHGATGTLSAVWATLQPELMFAIDEGFQIAEFGEATCDIRSYSLPVDAPVELSDQMSTTGQATIDAFNATTSVAVDWASGETTKAALHFTPDRDGACAWVYTEDDAHSQTLAVPGVLELRSDDGRVDARWPGALHPNLVGADGDVTSALFDRTLGGHVSSDPTPADVGFPLASDEGLDALAASYWVQIDDGVASGSIELTGFRNPQTGCELPDDPACNFMTVRIETGTLR